MMEKNWQPVKHTVLRDDVITETLHKEGITKVPFVSEGQIAALQALFYETHDLQSAKGGMFYSVYSHDSEYRKKVDEEIRKILLPSFEHHFKNYENVINMFIVKMPGPASEFAIHQDMTALDEHKHSPLSVWLPLHDINLENGGLAVVPRSQGFFSPYRGQSFPFPFADIKETIKDYLEPVLMQAGEAILFDPRILHNSLPNTSDNPRIAIVAGIFPKEHELVTCYKAPEEDIRIELIRHEREFLLTNDNFFHDCHLRPKTGETLRFVEEELARTTREGFIELCNAAGISPANSITTLSEVTCQMISEPDHVDNQQEAPLSQESPDSNQSHKKQNFFRKLFG